MIEAKKSRLFEKGFGIYLLPLLRKSFSHLLASNVREIPRRPVIFIANHSSWWDGLLFFQLNHKIWKHDIHMMMHEKNLKNYIFFRYLGAFSIDRQNPKNIIRSLQYTEELLNAGKSVVLFPQGDEFHQEIRPLAFHSGIGYLLEKHPDIPVVPITFYYSFRHEQKPEVWIRQGEVLSINEIPGETRKEKSSSLQQILTSQLDGLREEVIAENTDGFIDLLKKG
ncbi:lysophospholipid acyltransferase family protein [Planococcus sp. CAU13]|uniref:lysophospholipid acyltransferase family protein n=1 Tax=Planococcus sp. CAU13 TaxID=1541197 RepID=UPI00052FF9AB|nr:lysophospholipid acyltransferase family protein [Planococcus sp. CAU13]